MSLIKELTDSIRETTKAHTLKLEIGFCSAVLNGEKNFEIRFNDRGFQKNDIIKFIPYSKGKKCEHEISKHTFEIIYVLNGWGLKNGFVALGLRKADCSERFYHVEEIEVGGEENA